MSHPSAHRPWPVLAIAAVFVVACVSVPLVIRSRKQQPVPPEILRFTERLQASRPHWHIISVNKNGDLRQGFHICTQPRKRSELESLTHPYPASQMARWQGIVYCYPPNMGRLVLSHNMLPSWGDRGLEHDGLVLFGDPTLLQEIRTLGEP